MSEGDVSLNDSVNPSMVRVHIKASKTDPFRRGVYVYLGKTGNELCPVAAVAAYMVVRGSLQICWSNIAHGMDVSQYSGHSFRIGAATAAYCITYPLTCIETCTDHSLQFANIFGTHLQKNCSSHTRCASSTARQIRLSCSGTFLAM